MATFCRKCGAHNEPDARFCESCGSPMPVSMQPAADVVPQALTANHQGRSQQPRRSWVLYAVGALAILGIGIVAALSKARDEPGQFLWWMRLQDDLSVTPCSEVKPW